MDLVTLVYLADILPNIAGIFIGSAIFACAVAFFALMIGITDESEKRAKKVGFIAAPIGIFLALFAAIIPSKTTMYMMAGASIAQEVHRDERTKKVYEKLYQVIDEQLDKALKKNN